MSTSRAASSQATPVASYKSQSSPVYLSPSVHVGNQTLSGNDGNQQRRARGSGSLGAGSDSRSGSQPRSGQAQRKQHKASQRPKIADDDAVAETVAMQSTSSRKGRTSITHLMTFSLPPRIHHSSHQTTQQTLRHVRRNPSWGVGSGYHPADKARYIHANYRFIVKPNGDYRAQTADADMHLNWTDVLQILVSARSQRTNCPICLSEPVAPRVVECGHIFCLPCLIRYMHSTDDSQPTPERKARWKKCPICFDTIYMSDARPVRFFSGQEGERPRGGTDVVLRLLVRQPGSIVALPREGAERPDSANEIPWYIAAEIMDYARIMKGTEEYMRDQHDQEIELLDIQEREDELLFDQDPQWTKKAKMTIQEALARLDGLGGLPSTPNQPQQRRSRRPPVQSPIDGTEALHLHRVGGNSKGPASSITRGSIISQYERSGSCPAEIKLQQTASDSSVARPPVSDNTDDSSTASLAQPLASASTTVLAGAPPPRSSALHHSSRTTPFYFYEALHHYYLSPLDIRILKAAFGDYSQFPSTILPRVEHVSHGHIVDDDLRKKAKYLAHLPQGCEVGFLECDWTDVVGRDVIQQFGPELERRRKKNQEKSVREEKERLRAEKEEDDKRWANARRRRLSLSQFADETVANSVAKFESPNRPDRIPAASMGSSNWSTSPPWPHSQTGHGHGFASLATVSPSTSPSAARATTVWGTRIVPPPSPPLYPNDACESENTENDGWLQDWEEDLLREDNELATQLEVSSLAAATGNAGERHDGTPTSGARRKKGKKITLMSTNTRRGA